MNRLPVALIAAALTPLALLAAARLGRASDHLDGPRTTADPQSDITDVFAFTSPESPGRVVLAMAVTPYASSMSAFSPLVDYAFRVQRVQAVSPLTVDATARDVLCDFDDGAPQKVTCRAPGGLSATATVGDVSGGTASGGAMKVFAGLRSDPAFFDRQGALATVASGRASFTGQNAFAGANVLAIVVELDSARFLLTVDGGLLTTADGGSSPSPILAVAAETTRRGT